MPKELILVEEPQLAILASRMSFVTLVVGIADPSVGRQLLSRVATPLVGEDLQIICANLAEEQLMDLSDMFLQLVELHKRLVVALGAPNLQQTVECFLNFQVSEHDAKLLLVQSRTQLSIQRSKRSHGLREYDLRVIDSYQ